MCKELTLLEVLEIIKECFDLNGFDELIPNSKWFDIDISQRAEILKKITKGD